MPEEADKVQSSTRFSYIRNKTTNNTQKINNNITVSYYDIQIRVLFSSSLYFHLCDSPSFSETEPHSRSGHTVITLWSDVCVLCRTRSAVRENYFICWESCYKLLGLRVGYLFLPLWLIILCKMTLCSKYQGSNTC